MATALHKKSFGLVIRLAIILMGFLAGFSTKAQPGIPGYTGLGVYNGHYYYISHDYYFGKDTHLPVANARAKIQAIEPGRPANQDYVAAILNMAENNFI